MKKGLKRKTNYYLFIKRRLQSAASFFCTVFGSAMPAFAMNGNADPVTYINNFIPLYAALSLQSVPLYCCGQSYSLQLR